MTTLCVKTRTVTSLKDAKKLNTLISIIAVEIISELGTAIFNHTVRDDNTIQLVLPIILLSTPMRDNPQG